jgi:hypothetical protein
LDLLFGNQKAVEADIPQQNGHQVQPTSGGAGTQHGCRCLPINLCCMHLLQLTVAEAMAWARDNLLTDRPELFMKGSSV